VEFAISESRPGGSGMQAAACGDEPGVQALEQPTVGFTKHSWCSGCAPPLFRCSRQCGKDPPGARPTGRAFLGSRPMVSPGLPGVAHCCSRPSESCCRGLGWA